MKIGLIGRGGISAAHESAYRHMQKDGMDIQIVAYCDICPERLEGLEHARTYTDIDTFLTEEQGKLDYVDICLPTYLHAEVSVKALRAGYHVLCEKPMALNPEQTSAMLAAAKASGKHFMIAHCCRFMGATKLMRDVILSGELGKVCNAEFYREGGSREPMGYQNWFRNGDLSGGVLLDLHIHDVDLIVWLFGMPKAVSAAAKQIMTKNGYDSVSVNYFYENGMYINAKSDWSIAHDQFNTRGMRINFEKGYMYLDRTSERNAFVKVTEDGTVTDLWPQVDADMYYNELCYYIDCLKKGIAPELCPPEQSAEAVRLVMAEMRSADLGGERVVL